MSPNDASSAHDELREILGAGLIIGVFAGILAGFFFLLYSSFIGSGFGLPVRMVAAGLLGVDALIGGTGTLVLGVLLHLVISIAWGTLYAGLVGRQTTLFHAVLGGLGFGIFVMAAMALVVAPALDHTFAVRIPLMLRGFIVAHLLYGALLGLSAPLRRWRLFAVPDRPDMGPPPLAAD
jgi:hypothetical protein